MGDYHFLALPKPVSNGKRRPVWSSRSFSFDPPTCSSRSVRQLHALAVMSHTTRRTHWLKLSLRQAFLAVLGTLVLASHHCCFRAHIMLDMYITCTLFTGDCCNSGQAHGRHIHPRSIRGAQALARAFIRVQGLSADAISNSSTALPVVHNIPLTSCKIGSGVCASAKALSTRGATSRRFLAPTRSSRSAQSAAASARVHQQRCHTATLGATSRHFLAPTHSLRFAQSVAAPAHQQRRHPATRGATSRQFLAPNPS